MLNTEVHNRADTQRRQHALHQTKKGPDMCFNVGDFVLVPSYGNAANKSVFHPFKPMVDWQGHTRSPAPSPVARPNS